MTHEDVVIAIGERESSIVWVECKLCAVLKNSNIE